MNKKSKYVKSWCQRRKEDLVKLFGDKCFFCELESYPQVYDFHHITDNKDFNISGKTKSFEKLIEEAKKCIMLCSNCHRLVHSNILKIDMYYETILDENKIKNLITQYDENKKRSYFKKTKRQKQNLCLRCGKETKNEKFCSVKCSSLSQRKVERPLREELEILLITKSKSEIARNFGVSSNAVNKWIKNYGVVAQSG
jgi:hypothetical protein